MATDAELDAMQWVADPHADDAIAAATCRCDTRERLRRIDALNAAIRAWEDNAAVAAWQPGPELSGTGMGEALQAYLAAAQALPEWADRERIARAERLFMEHGALSVTLLFCASLPECYVVPDLAAVLDATGQLEERAEHRIRTTGAMIFPVMMEGGLTSPQGAGIAQVMKVRLIHAMIRNLILQGGPEPVPGASRMAQALHAHGWDLEACGLPNNQEELAYTLLTFSYVFLRALRRLGIPFTREEEEDYLHAWNVAGSFLGIRRELMVDTMDEAAALFAQMQARGRADRERKAGADDPRPRLGAALMDAMKSVIPDGPFKAFPVLLTRRLVEPESARDLGLDGQVSWIAKTMFATIMGTARGIDALGRRVSPGFSISRLVTRAIGYRLTCALLMSQTRELSVPGRLRPGIRGLIAQWGRDARAPGWMNALEDRFTTAGDWETLERPAPR